jgi:hypothetical protein
VLAARRFTSTGGGDDFESYQRGADQAVVVYLFGGGRWEAHDYTRQPDDRPEHAAGRGHGAEELEVFLETYR